MIYKLCNATFLSLIIGIRSCDDTHPACTYHHKSGVIYARGAQVLVNHSTTTWYLFVLLGAGIICALVGLIIFNRREPANNLSAHTSYSNRARDLYVIGIGRIFADPLKLIH